MTREEEIKELESMRMDLITTETSEWMSEKEKRHVDACDMAIDALKFIPSNATNGDVIKALFPYIEPKTVGYTEYVGDTEVHGREVVIGDRICLDNGWWNAPYRKER